jgi:aspartyl/asparaginyl-tRNA synthetase
MDVLVPGVGELIDGSHREERFEELQVCVYMYSSMRHTCSMR